MNWLSRLFARLFGRRTAPRPTARPLDLGPATAPPSVDAPAAAVAPAAVVAAAPEPAAPPPVLAPEPPQLISAAALEAEASVAGLDMLTPPEAEAELEAEAPPGAATVEVEEDEELFEAEELASDAADDPEAELDARPDLDVIVAARLARMGDFREEAERLALSGEQRVRLTDPAGPGTLAEALARLEQEGRVTSRLDEDEEGAPVLVYSPAAGGSTVH